jgi:cytochrome c553
VIYRNKRLLELLREAPCQVCGIEDGTVVAAHSNQLRDGKGRSIKAHDFRIAAMCYRCHTRCDQGADLSKPRGWKCGKTPIGKPWAGSS